MRVIKGLEGLRKKYKSVVLTIGNFDGVHIGHRKIFDAVTSRAKEIGGASAALTFEPHPMKVISPEKGIRILTPTEEKIRLIESLGVDALILINFNREFAGIDPDDFIRDVLVGKIGASDVIVGHNYAFGRGKKGTTALLRRRGRKYGFNVKVVRNARLGGNVVSSSHIRGLLLKGRVSEASRYLGRPYMIEGTVIKGAGRGEKLLGIPTANIETPSELIPKEGVYAVKVGFGGRPYDAVLNIGCNPTFGCAKLGCEAHILKFKGNILGRNLRVYFIKRIRDEIAFPDAYSLGRRINEDIERAKEILGKGKLHL